MQAATAKSFTAREIVLVSTDPENVRLVQETLAPGCVLRQFSSLQGLQESDCEPDAILVDIETHRASTNGSGTALEELRVRQPGIQVAAIGRSSGADTPPVSSSLGVTFLLPAQASQLAELLRKAPEVAGELPADREMVAQTMGGSRFCDLMGSSEPMQRLYNAILRVAGSSTTVLIRGESGTGKELVARAIVASGPRRNKAFISLNCAALPESLIEAELFGYEKGSFTGAVASKPGHIELADGGTLFLDEIATLTLPLQSKLLRVLEDRAVQRLGSKTSSKIDFRLLTATNEDLEAMVREGRFRDDLYYRIHVVPIQVPPLRERQGDIALLADHFLKIHCTANNVPLKRLELEALEVLEENEWAGNVRELENLIQRLVLMVESRNIAVHHLPQQILYTSASQHESLLIPDEGIDFEQEMSRIETAYLNAALRRAGGKKVLAAALLRVTVQKVHYLCRKHRIEKFKN